MRAGLVLTALLTAPAMACGPDGTDRGAPPTPPIAAALNGYEKDAALSSADRAKIKELRAKIDDLVKVHKEGEARKVEEQAMAIMAIARCGSAAARAASSG